MTTQFDDVKNVPYGTVATAPTPADSGTSLTLQPGQGALMPAAPFEGAAWQAGQQALATNIEFVRVTDVVGDTLTIERQSQQPGGRSIQVGDQFAAATTARDFLMIHTAINNLEASLTGVAQDSSVQEIYAEQLAQDLVNALQNLSFPPRALQYARTTQDQLRVNVDSGSIVVQALSFGNYGSPPTWNSQGGPNSMDAREIQREASNQTFHQLRNQWTFS